MKGSAIIIASLALMLSAAPAFAQTPTQPPAQPPAQPKPATPTPPPAQPPVQPKTVTPAPATPPAPFPAGAKIAFFQPELIFQNSVDGKAGMSRVQALITKKQGENAEKAKALQANQQKLQTSGSVMNEAARSQLEKEIERQQKDAERFQQDAQAEINELQSELQQDFQKKLFPILQQLAQEKGLHLLLSAQDAGVIWNEPGIDLTAEAIKKLDAATAPKPGAPKE